MFSNHVAHLRDYLQIQIDAGSIEGGQVAHWMPTGTTQTTILEELMRNFPSEFAIATPPLSSRILYRVNKFQCVVSLDRLSTFIFSSHDNI
jgi:hypothetical protein